MWKVIGKGKDETFKVLTLSEAMNVARHINGFVTITDGTTEIVGMFGVDEVKDKVLPDGTSYDWTMRRGENKSWRKKLG